MATIITCNTNGIRAAARKGFCNWLAQQEAHRAQRFSDHAPQIMVYDLELQS